VLIALNEPSLRKFLPTVEPGGLVLYNADRLLVDCPVDGVRMTPIASTAIADRLGSPKVGNMVMLGALLEATGMLPDEALERAMHRLVTRESWYELDRAALQAGRAEMRGPASAAAGPSPPRGTAGG
jgi:Pyruvate/2-oxoacid:ferredoxin oxidoreductase gamma subunit